MDTMKYARKIKELFWAWPKAKKLTSYERAREIQLKLDDFKNSPSGYQKSHAEESLITCMAENLVHYYKTSYDASSITRMVPVCDMGITEQPKDKKWITPDEFCKLYPEMGRGSSIIRALAANPLSLDYGCAKKLKSGRWLLDADKVLYFFSVSAKNSRYQPRAYKYHKENMRKKNQKTKLSIPAESLNPFPRYAKRQLLD